MPIAKIARFFRESHGTHRGFVRTLLAELEYVLGRLDAFVQPELKDVERLVFVCQGNICRSCYGDWLARRLGLNACSFGLATTTNQPAFPDAVEAAARFGVDLGAHRTTDVRDFKPLPGDLYLVMEPRQARRLQQLAFAQRIALLGAWASPHRMHLHDPHTLSRGYFQTCFTLIHSAVVNLAYELAESGSPAAKNATVARRN